MPNILQLAKSLRDLDEKIVKCMRCGTCQSVCPVFAESLAEGDVARGKLALLSKLSQEILRDAKGVNARLDRCLLCGSCQCACPSGVSILDIFLRARAICAEYLGLNPIKKIVFRLVLCNPRFFALLMRFSPLSKIAARPDANPQNTRSSPLLKCVMGDRHIPDLPSKTISQKYGHLKIPAGKSGIKVLFFPGCMGDKVYTSTTEACIKIFRHFGVGVEIPQNMSCCGIPALASGDVKSFESMARQNLAVFEKCDFDYIITACPSCTETIKTLWAEYSADPALRQKAEKLAAKTLDISEFIADVLKAAPAPAQPAAGARKITYHDSCHLKKSLGVWRQPRELIKANPNYAFCEMNEADRCCGCGGSFTLTHYDISKKIGERKARNIIESGADIVAAGCPACIMQISNVLALANSKAKARHVAEIFAETLGEEK